LAEWLGTALQKLLQRFESARDLQKRPLTFRAFFYIMLRFNNLIHWAGLASCALLIIACFLPWVYFNSIDTTFTGFKVIEFPNGTYYGKAGNIILPITAFILIFMLVSKVWAKRVNLFLASFLLAFSIRSYIVFTSSLFDGEVDKKIGIY